MLTVNPASPIDLSSMETISLDVWRSDETAELRLKLVDFGSDAIAQGADNSEHQIILSAANGYPTPTVGQWTHLDIPLSDFTGLVSTSNIGQIILSSHIGSENSSETLFMRQYIYK